MNPRIEKLTAKYERNAAKITALEEEQKELEKRLRELRNNDILEVAHAFSMDAEQLASLLNGLKTVPAQTLQHDTTEEVYHEK